MKVIEQEIHSLKNSISEIWALSSISNYTTQGRQFLPDDKELASK